MICGGPALSFGRGSGGYDGVAYSTGPGLYHFLSRLFRLTATPAGIDRDAVLNGGRVLAPFSLPALRLTATAGRVG